MRRECRKRLTSVRQSASGGLTFLSEPRKGSATRQQARHNTHPRLRGVSYRGEWTSPLFLRRHLKRCPRERLRCLTPWRDARVFRRAVSMLAPHPRTYRRRRQPMHRDDTTSRSDEEENLKQNGTGSKDRYPDNLTARGRAVPHRTTAGPAAVGSFITTHYWYHTNTKPTNQPTTKSVGGISPIPSRSLMRGGS